ncbi:gamma-tubulin complex component 3 homolog [Styela clava]
MATKNRNQPTPEVLINELCVLLSDDNPRHSQKLTAYALRMLSDLGDQPIPNCNENTVIDRIKRDLATRGMQEKAAKISDLYRRLAASGRIQNLWSVLYLLRSLSKDKSKNYTKNTLLFRQGLAISSTPLMDLTPPASRLHSSGNASSGFGTVNSQGTIRSSNSGLPSSIDTPANDFQSMSLGSRLAWGITPSTGYNLTLKTDPSTTVQSNDGKYKSSVQDKSRVSSSSSHSNKTKVPVNRIADSTLLRELLHVFRGTESENIKMSSREDAFRITPKATVDKRTAQMVHKLAELGWLHNRIRKYIDKHSKDLAFGLVGQAFCAALVQELQEYYRFLSVLQSQSYKEDQGFAGDAGSRLTFYKLLDWTSEPKERLQWVAMLVDNCKDRKGGALASTIHAFMQTGDVSMRLLTKRLLVISTQPIFYILSRWIYDGELQDTFHEFFVAMDPTVNNDRLWYDKYHLRQSMVPSFMTDSQARKILLVGKSLNFLRLVCRDRTEVDIRNKQEFQLPEDAHLDSTLDFGTELQERVDEAYEATSRCLLNVLSDRYKLLTHLRAMRKFLLLGQGDFVRHLLDLLHDDLARPAGQLYRHNLNGLVEAAVRATNAQFEDQDVQSRLNIRLLEINPGDTGWDVFSLDYHINQPLSTIITPDIMLLYLRCFNFLWRAKRMEHNLATIWTDTMEQSMRLSPHLPELRGILHMCHTLAAQMVHLVHQIQYYIAFEVLECSWADLLKRVESAKDLDEVIVAHRQFLEAIMKRCLLDQGSQNLLTQLRSIFDQIVLFETLKGKIYEKAMDEMTRRNRYENFDKKGIWSEDSVEEAEEIEKRRVFKKENVPKMRAQLSIRAQTFQDMVIKFLGQLTSHADPNLRYLSQRLDFNDHYKLKDPTWKLRGITKVKK